MSALLGRIVVMAAGVLAAGLGALIIAGIGLAEWGVAWFGSLDSDTFLLQFGNLIGQDSERLDEGLETLWLIFIVAPLAVTGLAALIAEAFSIRSWLAWGPGLGLLFAAAPFAAAGQETALRSPHGLIGLTACGIVAGSIYWLIAGRTAGRWLSRPI